MAILILVFVAIIIIVAIVLGTRHSASTDQQPKQRHNPYYMERMADAKRQAEEREDQEALQAIQEDPMIN